MAVLVDRAVWQWRGRRWAHLVSDADYDELHAFAQRIGKFRLAFQGDHYDVDEPTRARAVAAGALEVDSRVLVRRLRRGGLRRRDPWRLLDRGQVTAAELAGRLDDLGLPVGLAAAARRAGHRLAGGPCDRLELTVLERSTEVGLGLRGRAGTDPPELGPLDVAEVHVWSDAGRPLVELIARR